MPLHPYPSMMPRVTAPSDDRPLLIGFLGTAASGKTTMAQWCKSQYGGEILPFAAPVKVEVYRAIQSNDPIIPSGLLPANLTAFPVLPNTSEMIAWVDKNKSALRPLLQFWGTDLRRAQDPNYWITQHAAQIEALRSNGCNAIYVDDTRFINEADALGAIGFQIVRVVCGHQEQIARATARDGNFDPAVWQHASETQTLYYGADFVVDNSNEIHQSAVSLNHFILQYLNRQ